MPTHVSSPPRRTSAPPPEIVDGRYQLGQMLGKGGMAVVYQALDTYTQKHVALKMLRSTPGAHESERRISMFELEFHTLAQLAHPRVVEAYDYGLTPEGPYYTMELLDGGDLSTLAPLPWKQACSLLRDICSVLALLHSRRLVYRDLSTRNIRCTADGKAKLIDFGAMAAVGPSRDVVGSPPFVAPEALNLQPIQGSADLYGVGAALYYALVGRHAYPAKDLHQLPLVWQSPPPRPGELVHDLPPALDNLVMRLLEGDPASRPASAAEVMEELQAIAALPGDDQLQASRAHLSTPTLVGRDDQLARIRRRIARVRAGRGNAVLIAGASGMGRTRLLDACVLEATLAGILPTRASVADAQAGEYGAVRAVANQLLASAPQIVRHTVGWRLPIIGHAVPELLELRPDTELEAFGSLQELRPRLQTALREWLVDVSRERSLLLAIDDIDRLDEPSVALFAVLGELSRDHSLLVVASHDPETAATASQALELLSHAAKRIEVEPLRLEETRELLASVFGAGERCDALASRLQAMAFGNPRDVMRLAQHLVDNSVISYQAGAWTLPAEIAAGDLPSSVSAAMRTRLDALEAGAVELAQGIALANVSALSFEDCVALTDGRHPRDVLRHVESLIAEDIVSESSAMFSIQQRVWIDVLLEAASEERCRVLHGRLAERLEARGDNPVRVVQHLMKAGETRRAVDMLVDHAKRSQEITGSNGDEFYRLLHSLPGDWKEAYAEAFRLCEQEGRPRADLHALRARFVGLVVGEGARDTLQQRKVLEELKRDAGLDIYESLDASLDPEARLKEAFERAQARYDALAETERVLSPLEAIRPLTRAVIQALGIIVPRYDMELLHSLPNLEPFEPLSPAIVAVNQLVAGIQNRLTARFDQARDIYDWLLERLAAPDRSGLDDSHNRAMRLGVASGMGIFEASLGLARALDLATMLEAFPIYQVNGLCIRMLHSYWQGDARSGDELKKQLAVLRVQNTSLLENTHLVAEVRAYVMAEDLTRLRRVIKEIEGMAEVSSGWMPVVCYARGEYARLCGDLDGALHEHGVGLERVSAGEHQIWPSLAAARVQCLVTQGRLEDARAYAEQALHQAAEAEVHHMSLLIRVPLVLALAQLGELERAAREADTVIERFEALGVRGLNLGVAYEARARVALAARDREACERLTEACAAELERPGNRWCQARVEHLRQDMRAARMLPEAPARKAATGAAFETMLRNELTTCTNTEDRALRTLTILIEESGAEGGALFDVSEGGVEPLARIRLEDEEAAEAIARRYYEAELAASGEETEDVTASDSQSQSEDAQGGNLQPVLLAHRAQDGMVVTGLAVLEADPRRPLKPVYDVAAAISRTMVRTEITTAGYE